MSQNRRMTTRRMRRTFCFLVIGLLQTFHGVTSLRAASSPSWLEPYREPAARLIGEATGSTFAWQRLAVLTDSIGHRLSGSAALDRAVQWAVDEMKRDGLENGRTGKGMA